MSHSKGPGRMLSDDAKKSRDVEDKILWKWMFSYIKEYKGLFFGLVSSLLIFTILAALAPLVQKKIIDDGILKNDWGVALYYIVLYGIFILSSSIGSGFINYFMGKMGTNIIYEVRADIFSNLQNISMDYYDKNHSGDIISIATNDVDQLTMVFGGQLAQVISDVFRGILMLILMLILNWELAILSFFIVPVFVAFSKLLRKKAKKAFKQTRKTISDVTQTTEENISGMKVIQAYGKQDKAANDFDKANLRNQKTLLKTRKIFAFFFPLIFFISGTFSALILMYGSVSLLNGITLLGNHLTIGTLTAMSSYLTQLFIPLMSIAMFQQFVQGALAASERIYILLNKKTEIEDPKNPVSIDNISGEIEFKNVTFAYSKRVKSHQVNEKDESLLEDQQKNKKHMKHKKHKKHKTPKVNKMAEMKSKMMEKFQDLLKDPKNLLKLSQELDKQTHGGISSSISTSGGSGGQMSSGGQMGNGSDEINLSKIPRNQMLRILASEKVPEEIFEQFSPTVKQLIKEHKEIEEHKLSTGDVLKEIFFKIPAGKTIAIVGPTGAGKTTLIKLISRFYDIKENSGDILIDGINIKDIKKEDLRNIIGMVPQDSFLFKNTILENIYYGKPNGEKIEMTDELLEISKFLGLHNFIENMPEKYDTALMENAGNLSVGQRQLISFARVLMVDPKILILDEATSSVDPYTETLIQDALNKAKKGRTTIIIAHRLSTIINADEIYVLKNGMFVENGNHEKLMALNGHYANLIEMQAQDVA